MTDFFCFSQLIKRMVQPVKPERKYWTTTAENRRSSWGCLKFVDGFPFFQYSGFRFLRFIHRTVIFGTLQHGTEEEGVRERQRLVTLSVGLFFIFQLGKTKKKKSRKGRRNLYQFFFFEFFFQLDWPVFFWKIYWPEVIVGQRLYRKAVALPICWPSTDAYRFARSIRSFFQ